MRVRKLFILLFAALLGLNSCASLSPSSLKLGDGKLGTFDPLSSFDDFLLQVRAFTIEDLKGAYAMAARDNDQVASICWQVAAAFLQQTPAETGSSTGSSAVGLATIIQSVRHAKTTVDKGVPSELRIGCAALYNDVRRDALAIAALAASRGTVKLPLASQP